MSEKRQVAEIHSYLGQELGTTEWYEITQEMIDTFANITGDNQWIHVDVARAAEGLYGTTIAHGFLVLSVISPKMKTILNVASTQGLNYGLNRVRFIEPVKAGSLVRGVFTLLESTQHEDEWSQFTLSIKIEMQGSERPACTAEQIVRYYH